MASTPPPPRGSQPPPPPPFQTPRSAQPPPPQPRQPPPPQTYGRISPPSPSSWDGAPPAIARRVGGQSAPEGDKSYVATVVLSYLFGMFGADRFYLGKTRSALVKLFTLGGFGYWWLIDLLITLFGGQRDSWGLRLRGYERHKKTVWIALGALFGVSLVAGLIALVATASVGEIRTYAVRLGSPLDGGRCGRDRRSSRAGPSSRRASTIQLSPPTQLGAPKHLVVPRKAGRPPRRIRHPLGGR